MDRLTELRKKLIWVQEEQRRIEDNVRQLKEAIKAEEIRIATEACDFLQENLADVIQSVKEYELLVEMFIRKEDDSIKILLTDKQKRLSCMVFIDRDGVSMDPASGEGTKQERQALEENVLRFIEWLKYCILDKCTG